jgi:hypothetical protein
VPLIVRGPGIEPGQTTDQLVSTIDLGPTVLSLAGLEVTATMQGQAFLGDQARPPREYVYASRDRHDTAYDMVRAARDKRYKYLRQYRPDLPYLGWIPYRNRHPIMEEIWRLHAAGELNEAQSVMFRYPRPVEELYDTETDPWEINNLAGDPAHAETLERLRGALDAWRDRVGDLGEIPETEMVRRWYPGGEQPRTAPPVVAPIAERSYGTERAADEEMMFPAPLLVQLHAGTQGASIGYTFEQGEDASWKLYSEPLRLEPGRYTLRAKAVRIGYRDSEEVTVKVRVT